MRARACWSLAGFQSGSKRMSRLAPIRLMPQPPALDERRKQIEIEDQEIKRKEEELMATIKLPAEAEAYKVQTIAEGNRCVG